MPEDTNDYEVGYGKPAGYRKMKILNTFLRSISASVNNYIYRRQTCRHHMKLLL